jgi:diadenosine tetraphosphate (Ap4A) HIT family hydrolase
VGDSNVQLLHKKLTSLNASKAGPFDVCFCVGSFDVDGSGGCKTVQEFPLPVYVQQLVGNNDGVQDEQGIEKVGSIQNLYHLRGKADQSLNMFQINVEGCNHHLLVGSCPRHTRISDDTDVKQQRKQCDLLFSLDWPQGMDDVLQVETEPLSYDVAQVALRCRPRYHVCPSTLYHVSPPYHLPNSNHVCRFLALASVSPHKPTKTTKFIHALGLEPLSSTPPSTTAPSILPCPFLPSEGSNISSQSPSLPAFARRGNSSNNNNNSEGYSRFAKSNKRSRQSSDDQQEQHTLEPPDDPNISTLFLYGLHKDVTGELQSTRSPKILQAFTKYHCSAVRHPPNAITTSTYCFLEFPSQKEALECILDCHGQITIDGVDLALKWAAPRQHNVNKRPRMDISRHYVTQEEAKDSTSLFFHPPKGSNKKHFNVDSDGKDKKADKTNDDDSTSGPPALEEGFAENLRAYLEKTLEDALNEGAGEGDERITAETEPALKVEVRVKDTYGFLEFASHAAATMALAAVTKSTDGGLIQAQPDGAPAPSVKLVGTNLRWAKGGPPPSKKGSRDEVLEALGLKRQIFPTDNRTDCWFCLASPSCETHLITGVYDTWYATMPKGPVHPGHILLVPITHTREGAWNLNDEWIDLVDKVQKQAASVYDMDLFIFERSMETKGGYHTHVQCVPVPRDCTTRLQTTMVAHAKASGFDLRTIQSDLGIKNMIGKNDPYFYAEIRTKSETFRFFYRHDTDGEPTAMVPLQFAREVLASVLKNPKLAHWKACVVDQEQETELATTFRNSFNTI